ncbi:serine hydrolase domain-containing protein [Sediminicola sp. 1XM1-17]|uniref:serine hydrolase domain-containing protein n=1 Tax=Sediminicola sp. 1XM1-17 TaxID=3127702 RepID=UPI003077D757
MKTNSLPLYLLVILTLMACSKDTEPDTVAIPEPEPEKQLLYFPPIGGDTWETTSLEDLEWDETQVAPLYTFLKDNGTKAFIILKDGKIVLEQYFNGFSATENHTWNSAAKTLTAFTVGLALEEKLLSLEDSSSKYMGLEWSLLTPEQEQKISIKHHLTMTTGLDFKVTNSFCTDQECLLYKNEPNTFWYYHNAPYTLLDEIISGAVQQEFKTYFNSKIRDKIGMQGTWIKTGYLNLFFSNARSMARFGLLNLNEGTWDETPILSNKEYFKAMTTSSQAMNPSYGYLWWLNGKSSFRIPGSEESFPGKLIPDAPDDLVAGLGANDQKLYVVPSKGLVIVRMGDAAKGSELGPTTFDNDLWIRLNTLIK